MTDEKSRPAGGGSETLTSDSTGTTLDVALRYAKAGLFIYPVAIPGVNPERPGKKLVRPKVKSWQTQSSSDVAQVRDWWTGNPYWGIGVDCGKSGLVVIDVDCHDGGPDGMVWLREQLGEVGALRPARTPTGGLHIYYRADPDQPIRNSAGKLAPGVDVRADGGTIFMPGTPTGDYGSGSYTWVDGEPDWADLPPVPQHVRERLAEADRDQALVHSESTSAEPTLSSSSLFSTPHVVNANDRAYTQKQAQEKLQPFMDELARAYRLPGVDRGLRAALMRFARQVAHHAWISEEMCCGLVLDLYRREKSVAGGGYADLDADDVSVIRDAYRYQERDRAAGDMDAGWTATLIPEPQRSKRRVDLRPFLDGSYKPPMPSVGGLRRDGVAMLYPGMWHTLIAKKGTGKSWFATWHCVTEMRAGRTVVYGHFEESGPGGTISRIRDVAPDLTVDDILERFVWLDCTTRWAPGEFAGELPDGVSLVILDGIIAAAGKHGEDPISTSAVAVYRELFVTPATSTGAAVLSLGHPPKARDRQREQHGFGSTAWLDEVDGVGFRLIGSRTKPIRRDHDGYSMLYSVKDRYGQVEAHGQLETDDDMEGWYVLGSFHVDSSGESMSAHLNKPQTNAEGGKRDAVDELADRVVEAMIKLPAMRFANQRDLTDKLKAAGVKFTISNLTPALLRLVERGKLDWPETGARQARPGSLTGVASFESADIKNSLPPLTL